MFLADIDECANNDCGGAANTCANGENKYTCTCGPGWTGGGDGALCTGIFFNVPCVQRAVEYI